MDTSINRRGFLAGGAIALGALGVGALAGCSTSSGGSSGGSGGGTSAETSAAPAAAAGGGGTAESLECDVVVAGLGASGLLAAYGAATGGKKVIAIDAATSMDGVTNVRTSAPFCVGSKLQAESPEPLTIKEFIDYLNVGTNYQSNQRALRAVTEATGRAVNVFIDAGMPFNVNFAETDSSTPMMQRGGHLYGVSGSERAEYFTKIMNEAGVDCRFSTTADSLIIDNGKVAGLNCTSDGAPVEIKAKAVILATGGFLGNAEEVAKYFAGAEIVCMGNELCKGAGVEMAQNAGAQMGKCFSISMNEYGGANSKASPTYSFRPNMGTNEAMRLPVFGGLLVNQMGDRFVNEGVMCEKTMFCCEPLVRDYYHYAICDADFYKRWSEEPISTFMGDARMQGMFGDLKVSDMEGAGSLDDQFDKAVEEGWAFKADSLAEIADHFALPDLEETVKAYNALCEAGDDEQFFKDAKYLWAIKSAPFYCVQSMPAGWLSLGGIKSDEYMHALDSKNNVIPGLFVVGADADLFTSPYYAPGSANGFAIGSGLIAGESAAKEV